VFFDILIIRLEGSAEYWVYSVPQFGGVHAFGYNSAESNRFGWNLEHTEYIVGGWPGRFWARSAQ